MIGEYRVHITDRALYNLEAISNYISSDSPQNAARMIGRILDAIDDLAFMPKRFRVAGTSRKHGSLIHARVVRPYIIYYRVDDSPKYVFIMEIRHGARQQPDDFE
jgi:plasmid stabilization system protein ParE